MNNQTLTTIIFKHLQKLGQKNVSRTKILKQVNDQIEARGENVAEEVLLKRYNIKFPDYLEYL